MTFHSRTHACLLVGALAVASFACGGGSGSMVAPDAMSSPVDASATILGTVQSASPASAAVAAASGSGLRVSVVGTSLAATTDDAGRFTLNGVPAGHVELRFEGSGIDARLEIEGLASGQTLTITVRVNGSSATRVDDDGDPLELRGTVDSVGASSLVVDGRTVRVDQATRLLGRNDEPIALSGIKAGDLVEVEGRALPDASVQATKVKLEGADDGGGAGIGEDVTFRGAISSLSPLTVADRTVTTDGSTLYLGRNNEPLSASQVLRLGNTVEVEGHTQAGGSVLASKIKLED